MLLGTEKAPQGSGAPNPHPSPNPDPNPNPNPPSPLPRPLWVVGDGNAAALSRFLSHLGPQKREGNTIPGEEKGSRKATAPRGLPRPGCAASGRRLTSLSSAHPNPNPGSRGGRIPSAIPAEGPLWSSVTIEWSSAVPQGYTDQDGRPDPALSGASPAIGHLEGGCYLLAGPQVALCLLPSSLLYSGRAGESSRAPSRPLRGLGWLCTQ